MRLEFDIARQPLSFLSTFLGTINIICLYKKTSKMEFFKFDIDNPLF
ncbi:hypothetical protein B4088_0942 [Bacillus cereus]|uniref:Uncharacterized protein n=1 Tax=Bacillus cereus TaxID=1396 RepID=A0A162PDA0_BACCE|nr:hypothetical protein B4088_0942 [Bacillus cereus]